MREILFRGKCIENKEVARGKMVYGDLIHRQIWNTSQVIIRCVDAGFNVYTDYEVDPETVGEYAGRSDIKGTKIFEGDIVRLGDTLYRVVFENRNGSAYFGLVAGPEETWPLDHYSFAIVVVGNIYDNPELLEGGDSND